MRSSEATDQIDRVIAIVQGKIESVSKDKTVKVDGERSSWESGYATLKAIDKATRLILKEHGVAVYQGGGFVAGLGPVLETRLAYQGQWIESFYPIRGSSDNAQKTGGGISFARRWGLCGMLKLIPEDVEEKLGYKDARADARPARKAAAPSGLAAQLDAIRKARSVEAFSEAVAQARADNPTGEAAGSVEKAINAWLVHAFSVAKSEQIAELRECVAKVKPRGHEVHEATRKALDRLKGGEGEPS